MSSGVIGCNPTAANPDISHNSPPLTPGARNGFEVPFKPSAPGSAELEEKNLLWIPCSTEPYHKRYILITITWSQATALHDGVPSLS